MLRARAVVAPGHRMSDEQLYIELDQLRSKARYYALSLTGGHLEDAEDIVSTAMDRIVRCSDFSREPAMIRKYFFQTIKRLYVDKVRSCWSMRTVSLDAATSSGQAAYWTGDRVDYSQPAEEAFFLDRVLTPLLGGLEEPTKTLACLVLVYGDTPSEAAAKMGLGKKETNRYHRVLARLRTNPELCRYLES
jgi:DNA-directed RNA polymerase specialized sigma24 family protein